VAERPLIQRNTTNTVRITSSEDIQYLPVRGSEYRLVTSRRRFNRQGIYMCVVDVQAKVAYYIRWSAIYEPVDKY